MNDDVLNMYIDDMSVSICMVSRLFTEELGHPKIKYFGDHIIIFQVTVNILEYNLSGDTSNPRSILSSVSLYLICQVSLELL